MPPTPALDGLRAVAITVVVMFHLPIPAGFVGGLFGVGIFFVLSGFLITPSLTAEFARTGTIRLGRFLARRARRLVPALAVLVGVLVLLSALFGSRGWFGSEPFGPPRAPGAPIALGQSVQSALAALGYVHNELMAHSWPVPQPYKHLWTLSIEGQFYLGWALLAGWLLRRGRTALAAGTAVLIVASAACPWLLWGHPGDRNLIYFSTAPHLQELLAGALLAQAWSAGWLARIPRGLLRAGAWAGAAVLVIVVFTVADVPLKYLGAETIVAAATVAVVAYLVDERSRNGLGSRLLSWGPVAWLGRRSYGVYLWHWPFALWTNELPRAVGLPLAGAATLAAAEASWRWIEQPVLRRSRAAA